MELKGSKTEANLRAAFAGESEARNKYTYYASKARKEGYNQIAALFEETAATRRSTPSCGSSSSTVLAPRRRTWPTPPPARTTSGPICTPSSPRRPGRRALTHRPAL